MSKSPLSGAFNENGAPEKKKNKKTGALLILAGVALTTSLGGVFAANTTISLGSNIEFGQGQAETGRCDATINTAVDQSYNGTTFYVSRVTLSDVNTTSGACGGKTIKVMVVDSAGASVCGYAGTDAAGTIASTATSNTSADVLRITEGSVTDAVIRIDPSTLTCSANTVDKVALSTSN